MRAHRQMLQGACPKQFSAPQPDTSPSNTLTYMPEPCMIAQVAGDPFGPGNLALGLRKGSPYKAALDRAMITLRSNGFIDVLRRQWLPADYCSNAALEVSTIGCYCPW